MITRTTVTSLFYVSLLFNVSALNPNLSLRHLSTAFECNEVFIPMGLVVKAADLACRNLDIISHPDTLSRGYSSKKVHSSLSRKYHDISFYDVHKPFPREYDGSKLIPNVRGKSYIYPLNLRSDPDGGLHAMYNVVITQACAIAGVVGKNTNADGPSMIRCQEHKIPFALVYPEKPATHLTSIDKQGAVCGIQFYPQEEIESMSRAICDLTEIRPTSPVSTLDGIDPIINPKLEREIDRWSWNLKRPADRRIYLPDKYNPHQVLYRRRIDGGCNVKIATTSVTGEMVDCLRTPIQQNIVEYYDRNSRKSLQKGFERTS